MTTLSPEQNIRSRRRRRSHFVPILIGSAIAAGAIAAVAYLLWPTWQTGASGNLERLPVSIGATVFNVPNHAFRIKVQKHSGPQERVDLSFDYPSLEPPLGPKHISAETYDDHAQSIDRIFLSISAHHDALAPEMRLQTIYPRYLDQTASTAQDGLTMRTFRAGSPYSGEDLFLGNAPNLVARCTREADTPGMCLSERRIGDADLTFRFPRQWLAQWHDVATAMDRLTMQLATPRR